MTHYWSRWRSSWPTFAEIREAYGETYGKTYGSGELYGEREAKLAVMNAAEIGNGPGWRRRSSKSRKGTSKKGGH